MLEHGGRLLAAASKYAISVPDWLDLSTGISPHSYPVPDIPGNAWQRLPETEDALEQAASSYYNCAHLLPTAGSQAAIISLPRLAAPLRRVGLLATSYAEHRQAWLKCGHKIIPLQETELSGAVDSLDVLIVCNPNNPTGLRTAPETLLAYLARLSKRGGWLIVDEAFADTEPERSLCPNTGQPGLIVLRSLGKFFGMAGARVGFIAAWADLLSSLAEHLGPWTVSGPSRFIATCALTDRLWQAETRQKLLEGSCRLNSLLRKYNLEPAGATAFFQWVVTPESGQLHEFLARQGILTRFFLSPLSIRFGLPEKEEQWQRLETALKSFGH